ncbi:14714_t:CDS:2, partial [Gigaspora margarita]
KPEILIKQDSESMTKSYRCGKEQNLQETEERIQNLIDTTEMLKADKHGKRCLEGNLLPPSQHENHLLQSLLYNEDVSLKIANYLRATKFKVNPRLVKQYFENNILPELQIDIVQTISLTTAWHWIKKIGFYYKWYQKGIYMNRHERENWLHIVKANLLPGEQKHSLITHDECTFHFYNGTHEFWAPEGLHISKFLVKTIGRLNDEEGEARSIIQLGVNNNGYWDRENTLPNYKVRKSNPKTVDCCALYLLANQSDFLSEHGLIQQEIEKHGYK